MTPKPTWTHWVRAAVLSALLLATATATPAPASDATSVGNIPEPVASKNLGLVLEDIVEERMASNAPRLAPDRVHVALFDLTDPKLPTFAEYNGYDNVYPASVVKMLYMGYVYHLAKQGGVTIPPQIYNTMHQMIHPSSNEATARIVDLWSGMRHDALMDKETFRTFSNKRNACNRWLDSLGLGVINANQKTWGKPIPDGERQFLSGGNFGGPWVNRNSMTAMSAARFLRLIACDALVDKESCEAMRALMVRDVSRQNYQKRRIAGGAHAALGDKAVVWSKSGTTTDTFHDAGIVRLKDGRTFILVVFITGTGPKGDFIRNVAADVCRYFAER